jgi:hypothetical protein
MTGMAHDLLDAANRSVQQLRRRIGNVRHGPIVGNVATIEFDLDGKPMKAYMRGRNVDYALVGGASDAGWALRALLDGDLV